MIVKKQLSEPHRSPSAVIDVVVIHEKLLGLETTTTTLRMTVYCELPTTTRKCPYVVVIVWMPALLLGTRAKENDSREPYEPVDVLSLGLASWVASWAPPPTERPVREDSTTA